MTKYFLPALFLLYILFINSIVADGQARLVLNGGVVNITQDAYLVIDNPASDAITRTTGYIVSDGENNSIKWNIGTTTGTYTIPWGYSATYIPITFTKTAGTGSGHFLFSTYHTVSQNSTQIPSGIANFNSGSGADNSAFAIDRFWQVNASGYLTKPSLSNLLFTYLDTEFASPNTSSVESSITAQRWNDVASTWLDYVSTGTVNVTANTLTLTSVTPTNLYKWWTVAYAPDRHWTAAAPSNWNDPSNWSYTTAGTGGVGIPSSLNSVILDATRSADLTLDANANISSLTVEPGYSGTISQGANTITISNGASLSGGTFLGSSSDINISGPLTIAGTSFTSTSASLNLTGDFTFNGGNFIHNNGSVNFVGTTATQFINGSVAAGFNNISVTNSAATPGVSIESNQNLTGVLTLATNTVVDADGSSNSAILTLKSTGDSPTQDAAVAILPSGASVTGSVTVQRFMTKEGGNNNRIYRYIASPVQNASVADLQNEIPITGSFTGTSACSGCGTGQTMFSYNESDITDSNGNGIANLDDGYIDFPNASNTETLIPGKGYAMFVRGNILTSTSWDVRGPINAGNVTSVSLPVSYTSSGNILDDGWSIVGNPYPSSIDWNSASGWTKTNLDATTYVPDNSIGFRQFATWNGVTGTNGGSRHIAVGQGFWVKANGAGTPVLLANENIKAAGTQATFFREGSPDNLLRITMAKGLIRDEAVIHFRADATNNFDAKADAYKLANGTFNLSSLQPDGKKLAINSIPPMDCSAEVKLNIANAVVGNYQLSFSEHDSFYGTTSIVLQDNFTGSTFNIRSGGSYDFSVTASPASYGADRFKVAFTLPPVNSDFMLSASNVCEESNALVQINNTQAGIDYTITSNQSAILLSSNGNAGTINFSIPGDNLKTGQNDFTVTASRNGCSLKIEKNITLNQVKKFEIESVEGAKICQEGIVTLKANGAPSDGSYNWYESESSVLAIADQHTSIFNTPSLTKSKTYYVSITNSLGCEGKRTSVFAKIITYDNAQVKINATGDSLQSNFSSGNQWYFNHQPIPLGTQQFLKPDQSGTYSTHVAIEGCVTSTDYEFVKAPDVIVIPEIILPETVVTAIEPSLHSVTFFPNPVIAELNVRVPASLETIKQIRLLNGIGQFIGWIELQDENGIKGGHYDLANYPAGLYILQVLGTQEIVEMKVIKQ